ncbi:MAG: GNAT family N-acetyltransferase [Anaerolineales bacterium]|nr:GNAT family N-acetyltransferase [Anaerolineales bacterium]
MNLTIRRAEPSDYEGMQKIFSGPKVIWGTLQLPYPSVDMWRKRLAENQENVFELVACVEGDIVGQVFLQIFPRPRRKHVGQIGMSVRDDFQGQGVGTALMQAAVDMADRWLNVLRLELDVYTDNEPAVRLYKKFGFEIEGTLKKYAYRDGEYVDVYAMARFRPENPS